jgi:outer membrane protein assembly factor BamB
MILLAFADCCLQAAVCKKQKNKKKLTMKNYIEKEQLYKITRRAALISALFAAVLSILLIANYVQTKSIDPLNSAALQQLMTQLQENPNDEALKQQIRALDLLARRAYFTNQWQLRTGGFILFVSVLVLLISLKYVSSLKPQLPDLAQTAAAESWEQKLLARRGIIYTGLAVFVIAFFLGILAENQLKDRVVKSSYPSVDELRTNWPTFRGPQGQGISYAKNPPTVWDGKAGDNIKWMTEVPLPGFNSPVVWDDKVFLSGADEESQQVYCFDTGSGELLWTTDINDIPGHPDEAPDVTEDTGFAAPTLAVDGERVFVIFATGDLACLDYDGKRLWGKNLGMPDNHYGHSSSLVMHDDVLLVQYDTNEESHLYGFRSAIGEQMYVVDRKDVDISWASPVIANTGSRDEIILNSNPLVTSYDPITGKELWRVDCMDAEVGPSVAYADGFVYAVNEYALMAAIKLEGTPHIAWENEDDLPEAASPVVYNGLLFMASSYGTVTCFDAQSGDVHWTHEFDDGFYSSPIAAGENIYLMDHRGVVHVFKAADEFELIADNPLGERADTVPAFMDGRIFIRGEKNLFCIGS